MAGVRFADDASVNGPAAGGGSGSGSDVGGGGGGMMNDSVPLLPSSGGGGTASGLGGPLRSTDSSFFSRKAGGSSVLGASFTVVATAVGGGVLGLPYALAQSGWLGLLVLLAVCVEALYTAKRLVRCMYSRKPHVKLRTYRAVGEAAFGPVGGIVAMGAQYTTLVSVATLFTVLGGANLHTLLVQTWGWVDWSVPICTILSSAVIILPFVGLKTMTEISFIAIFGFASAAFVVVVVIVFGLKRIAGPQFHHDHVKYDVFNGESFAFAFATIVFAFGGHSVYPTIQDEMRNKRDYKRMFNIAFFLMFMLYAPVLIIGYWAFGKDTQSPILNNFLAEKGDSAEIARIAAVCATVAITIHVWFTIPIVLNPVTLAIERKLGLHQSTTGSDVAVSGSRPSALMQFLGRTGVRIALFTVVTIVAISVPNFGAVMAIVGASTVAMSVFVLPSLFYLKLFWPRIALLEKGWISIVLMTATLGSTIGLYSAFTGILQGPPFNLKLHLSMTVFWVIVGSAAAVGLILITTCMFCFGRAHERQRAARNPGGSGSGARGPGGRRNLFDDASQTDC